MPKGWERTATDPKGEKLLGFVDGLNDNFDDTLVGFTGPDQLYGLGGNDKLDGGEGADKIFGGDGNDVLTGGDGRGADKDLLSGGAGDDVLVVTRGNSPGQIVDYDTSDVLDGGEGNDTADFYMFIGDHHVISPPALR